MLIPCQLTPGREVNTEQAAGSGRWGREGAGGEGKEQEEEGRMKRRKEE